MFSSFFPSAAAAAAAAPPTQWYYYTQHDPRGMPDGWYVYDAVINTTVEQTYQQAMATVNGVSHKYLLPTASSGYQYELDFMRMVQKNTYSGRCRPIYRSTNGVMPPPGPPAVPPASSAPAMQAGFTFGASTPAAAGFVGFAAPVSAPTSNRPVSTQYACNLTYRAPDYLHSVEVDDSKVFQQVAPPATKRRSKRHMNEEEKKCAEQHEDDCAICLDALWDGSNTMRVVALKSCQHLFHHQCIREALAKGCGGKCPLCSKPIDEHECGTAKTSLGKCPSGTMKIVNMPGMSCRGYEEVDLLKIDYSIPSGTQKRYHPSQGLHFSGASRTAYIPNNTAGRNLLNRIQYAFMHGLCFMVGTSLTSHQANTVTWASIHHKTSYYGGTYGFPDPTYFQRANDELNALGVPDPTTCRAWLRSKCPGYV